MFCNNCGAPLADGTAFCGNCGAAQETSTPAPTAPTPIPPTPVANRPEVTVVVTQPVAAPPPITPAPAEPWPTPANAVSPQPQPPKSYKGLIIGLIVLIVVTGLGVTGWFLYDNGTFDDLFGGSSPSSAEESEKSSSSSSGESTPQSQPQSSEGDTNSSVNSTVESAPIVYTFEQGSLSNGVYTNKWVNLKYDTNKLPEAFTIELPASLQNDFEIYNASDDSVYVDFFANAATDVDAYFDQIYQETLNYYAQSSSGQRVTAALRGDVTIADESYRTLTLTIASANGSFVHQRCCRLLDNYVVEVGIIANNANEANSYRSVFEAAR